MKRYVAILLALVVGALGASCNGESSASEADSTTTTSIPEPLPPLPTDINAIPYALGARVGLGNVQLTVHEIIDPYRPASASGSRTIALDVTIRNGAVDVLTLDPSSFRVYVDSGQSVTPTATRGVEPILGVPMASDEEVTGTLVYVLPDADALPVALVFDGQSYGERVLSGLVSLDPDYDPSELGTDS
ncbi:MAG TPA: DUF4352 domain-containing protein [Acidimicrobiia bacterium]|nr:DUF4352 domain-containing protein [Acidimicrobiia bacterium]